MHKDKNDDDKYKCNFHECQFAALTDSHVKCKHVIVELPMTFHVYVPSLQLGLSETSPGGSKKGQHMSLTV